MHRGTIFKIKKYALHDGPGIRTTVFLKGCPLRCRWCHNPEGLDPHPQPISRRTSSGEITTSVGRVIGVEEVVREVEKDQLFYDESGGGVTFSGGEPLSQPQFLEALLSACNAREIHATLDTSGYAPPDVMERLLPRVQLILFDLKIIDDADHHRHTGVSNRIILGNLARIAASSTPLRIRLPLVSGITDGDDNITAVIRLADTLKCLFDIDLLPFHRIGAEKYPRLGMKRPPTDIACPSPERVAGIQTRLESAGFRVTIGG
jgi:pyruvate formate lyase activating enzyme